LSLRETLVARAKESSEPLPIHIAASRTVLICMRAPRAAEFARRSSVAVSAWSKETTSTISRMSWSGLLTMLASRVTVVGSAPSPSAEDSRSLWSMTEAGLFNVFLLAGWATARSHRSSIQIGRTLVLLRVSRRWIPTVPSVSHLPRSRSCEPPF
jgi:hypothetical protein